jgi:hypothetical protein
MSSPTSNTALFAAADQALIKHSKAFIAYQNTLVQWTAPDGVVYIDIYPVILQLKADYQI